MDKFENIKNMFIEFWNEAEKAYLYLFKGQRPADPIPYETAVNVIILVLAIAFIILAIVVSCYTIFFVYNLFCVLFIDKHIKNDAFEENDFTKEVKRRKALDKALKKKGYNLEMAGKIAETDCVKALTNAFPNMEILQNVYPYIKESDDKISVAECDIIGMTDKNIYVFEVKNYSGIVYPTNDTYWLNASYADITPQGEGTYKFSPVRQNHIHIGILKQVLKKSFPNIGKSVQSIVVFADRTVLVMPDYAKDGTVGDAKVCNIDNLVDTINTIENASNARIDKQMILNSLSSYVNVSEEIKELSLQRAKSHFGR